MRNRDEDLKMLDFFDRLSDTDGEHSIDDMRRMISEWVLDLYSDLEELEEQNDELLEKLQEAEDTIQELEAETHLGRGAF